MNTIFMVYQQYEEFSDQISKFIHTFHGLTRISVLIRFYVVRIILTYLMWRWYSNHPQFQFNKFTILPFLCNIFTYKNGLRITDEKTYNIGYIGRIECYKCDICEYNCHLPAFILPFDTDISFIELFLITVHEFTHYIYLNIFAIRYKCKWDEVAIIMKKYQHGNVFFALLYHIFPLFFIINRIFHYNLIDEPED